MSNRAMFGWNAKEKRDLEIAGAALKDKRQAARLTTQQLADRAQISFDTLGFVERGQRMLHEKEAKGLCRALQMDAKDFNKMMGYEALKLAKAPTNNVVEMTVIEPVAGPDECPQEMAALQSVRAEGPLPAVSPTLPAPELPALDLHSFVTAYQSLRGEIEKLREVVNQCGGAGFDGSTPSKAMMLIKQQNQHIETLQKAVHESKRMGPVVTILKTLRDLIDEEITKFTGG